jgi:tRNA threonylcarbamoyladenosine biosynthesis protein TsaE
VSDSAVFLSDSPERTREIAAALGRVAQPGDAILLSGPLGTGKTCFVQGLAAGLGVTHAVRSPTFVLLARYPGATPLVHLDLYRLEGRAAIEDLGVEEQLEDAVVAVEWGEKLGNFWPDALAVEIEETGPESRRMTVHGRGEAVHRLAAWQDALA